MAKEKSVETSSCCGAIDESVPPDHANQLHRIRRVRGQLDGVERMIQERRYCPDIIIQVQAIRAALSGLESKLLSEHLHHCVTQAFKSADEAEKAKKIEEIVALVRRS